MKSNIIKFRLAAYTDPAGKWNEDAPKKGNEDDLYVDCDLSNETQGQFIADRVENLSDAGCLMVVADGMGGMNAGEVASAIAIETVKDAFKHDQLTPEILSAPNTRTKYLEKVIVEADAAIKRRSKVDKECEGMGSTLIMAWLYENQVTVSWCGDSRAYLYRETDGIQQISKDHSYVQGLVDEGKITVEEAFDHPYGNIITRSLGDPEKKVEPESVTIPVIKGDIILICSDGLSGVLRDKKSYDREGHLLPGLNLEDIIRENRGTMNGCREALWGAAEKSEWYDNVTAILCEIMEGPETRMANTTEGATGTPVTKSFVYFKIRKKSLRIMVWAIIAACLGCFAAIVGKRLAAPRSNSELEVFLHQRDSLIKVADSLGIVVLKDKLVALPDTVNCEAIGMIGDEITQRNKTILFLEGLRDNASSLNLDGIARSINQQIDTIKSNVIYTLDISRFESSIFIGEKLLCEIVKALGNNSPVMIARHKQIVDFREGLCNKEMICNSDIDCWEALIKPIPTDSARAHAVCKKDHEELTEVSTMP